MVFDSDLVEAAQLKADALFGDKRYQAAATAYAAFDVTPSVGPDSKKYALAQQLRCGMLAQDYRRVVEISNAMIAANPNEASYYLLRGTACLQRQDSIAAIPDIVEYTIECTRLT